MPTSLFLFPHLRRFFFSSLPVLRGIRTLTFLFGKFLCLKHLFITYVGYSSLTYGASMLPTLAVQGDYVVVSSRHRHGRDIAVGDLVSFKHPCVPGVNSAKRVAGMPGDFVLRDTFAEGAMSTGGETMLQVPEGHCWVLGDNLTESRDSRVYGPLPLGLVSGKVVAKYPLGQRLRWIQNGLVRPEAGT